MTFRFVRRATVELLAGDTRAIGGAVTVALCGHWDHAGPCRWPHLTEVKTDGTTLGVTVSYTCEDDERAHVESLIDAAIGSGRLSGPEGVTTWRVARHA
jgi:hypothetical protein